MSTFYDEKRLSEHLHIPRRTLQRWRATGDGPAFIRAGERRILYRAEAVDEWAKAREHRHRAAEMVAQKDAAA